MSFIPNQFAEDDGEQRITMAFNALPDGIDSWGYTVHFS